MTPYRSEHTYFKFQYRIYFDTQPPSQLQQNILQVEMPQQLNKSFLGQQSVETFLKKKKTNIAINANLIVSFI